MNMPIFENICAVTLSEAVGVVEGSRTRLTSLACQKNMVFVRLASLASFSRPFDYIRAYHPHFAQGDSLYTDVNYVR